VRSRCVTRYARENMLPCEAVPAYRGASSALVGSRRFESFIRGSQRASGPVGNRKKQDSAETAVGHRRPPCSGPLALALPPGPDLRLFKLGTRNLPVGPSRARDPRVRRPCRPGSRGTPRRGNPQQETGPGCRCQRRGSRPRAQARLGCELAWEETAAAASGQASAGSGLPCRQVKLTNLKPQ
jgi:hypothetical protein